MTVAEFNREIKAYDDRLAARRMETENAIYALAGLIRIMIWSKLPPTADEFFGRKSEPPEMDDAAMYQQVLALNAMFGGSNK